MNTENTIRGNSNIGLLRESSLHASLKNSCVIPNDYIEVPVNGYLIDIVRGNQLIEIQTGNFSSIRDKLTNLLRAYPIHLVYPLAIEKWIIKKTTEEISTRRKSPKKGRLEHIFYELVKLSNLLSDSNLTIEIVHTREEEIQVPSDKSPNRRSWRRKGWVITDRRLIEIIGKTNFHGVDDYRYFLEPIDPDQPFTSGNFANKLDIPIKLSQKMLYCFLRIGLIEEVGKLKRSRLYIKK